MKLDEDRENELAIKRGKIMEERVRRAEALKQANDNVVVNMLKGSLAAKQENLQYREIRDLQKQKDAIEAKERADNIKQQLIEGELNKEKNSNKAQLLAAIEEEHVRSA